MTNQPRSQPQVAELSELIARLRKAAESASRASQMMAEAKSLRQSDNPDGHTDLYMWATPEQTLEWEAAEALASLAPVKQSLPGGEIDSRIVRLGAEAIVERLKSDCRSFDGRCYAVADRSAAEVDGEFNPSSLAEAVIQAISSSAVDPNSCINCTGSPAVYQVERRD